MKCNIGAARASDPMANVSSIAQVRFHKGWDDFAKFRDTERYNRAMDGTRETELWLGWPVSANGTEATGSGSDLTLDGGSYGSSGLELVP